MARVNKGSTPPTQEQEPGDRLAQLEARLASVANAVNVIEANVAAALDQLDEIASDVKRLGDGGQKPATPPSELEQAVKLLITEVQKLERSVTLNGPSPRGRTLGMWQR
jgi:multidrug resistance efflux pump